KAALTLRTQEDQPALSLNITTHIKSKDVVKILNEAARTAGCDPTRFSTLSVRIGGATTILNTGADRLVLKVMGRWLSNAFEAYPVLTRYQNHNKSLKNTIITDSHKIVCFSTQKVR
ncbi:hypothetical protein JG687_00011069, partial [Phytophthora cactorum]